MKKIKVTFEMCTLFKGVPNGPAIFHYDDHNDKPYSFRGVGIFNEGKLTNTSFTCVNGEGFGYYFSKMDNGRPTDQSFCTFFNKTDKFGWQFCSGQISKEIRLNGLAKVWKDDEYIYYGQYKDNNRT